MFSRAQSCPAILKAVSHTIPFCLSFLTGILHPNMTTSPRALMIGALEFATEELKELSQKFQIENVQSRTRQEFFDDCKGRYKDVTIAALTSDAAAVSYRYLVLDSFLHELLNCGCFF